MSDNQVSDAERGTQKAYEERTAPIQQHIRRLLDELRRLATVVRDNLPSAQDDVSRLVQRHATIRPLTQQLRNYIVEYLRADAEWDRSITEFRLYDNRSAWAQSMLQQRNAFYQGLSLANAPLDFLFAQLLEDVQRTLEDIERFIQTEPSRTVHAITSTFAPQNTAATAPSAEPAPRTTMAYAGTHSATTARPLTTTSVAPSNQSRPHGIRPEPNDQRHRNDASRRGTTTSNAVGCGNVRTFVNSSSRRTGTAGIMGITDGNVADAIPLAWRGTYSSWSTQGPGPAAPAVNTSAFYATAPPISAERPAAALTTPSVEQRPAEFAVPPTMPCPPRTTNPEQKQQLLRVFANTMAGREGPSSASSSNPLRVGADGRPFDSSGTGTAQATTTTAPDFGEDFARENSSTFYRNANYVRRPLQAGTVQPPLLLKESPLTPFEGDIRRYPKFRNSFLELVEAQRNFEPRHKLQYLLQHLRGTPRHLADGFPMSDESYFDVTNLLEQRYGNKTVLGNTLMQDLINLPTPRMKRAELQLFHDSAFRTIRNLRQVGPGFGADNLTVQLLLGKLPNAMKAIILEQHGSGRDLNANDVLKGVRDHVSNLERAHSAGLHLHARQPEYRTTNWTAPPGSFNQQNQHRNTGRPNKNTASNAHQFDRQVLPRLPQGFYIVSTNIGITIGGAGQTTAAPTSSFIRRPSLGLTALSADHDPYDHETDHRLREESPPPLTYRLRDGDPRTPPLPPSNPTKTKETTATLQTTEATSRARQLCPMCNLPHDAVFCPTYNTVNKRRQQAMRLRLCRVYLQLGHRVKECPKDIQLCLHCGQGYHHRILYRTHHKENHDPETSCYFCSFNEVPHEDAPPEEAQVKRHILPHHQVHPPQDVQNPLDTTEPLLRALITIFAEASTANSVPTTQVPSKSDRSEVEYYQQAGILDVAMMSNSRKTRLRCLSEQSGIILVRTPFVKRSSAPGPDAKPFAKNYGHRSDH